MNLAITNNQSIAQLIIDYLNEDIKELPVYYYIIGNFENNGLIITPRDYIKPKYLSSKNYYYSFEIRLYMSKNQHQIQLKLMDKIIDRFLSEDFNLMFNKFKLNINKLTLNDLDMPQKNWINLNLETFDNVNQLYMLKLDLVLKEIKNETNKC